MRKIIFSIFIIMLAFYPQLRGSVFAQTTTGTTPSTTNPRLQTAQDNKMANLKERADTEITRRIDALNRINTRLTNIKHLTDAQKSSFSSQISTEIANLTALKTKIDADTDLTTLKTDVQSIVLSYRVFALFIPQIQMVGAADRILNITDIMNQFATKLSTRITNAKNAGHDVTSLQALLTDMQSKITDAITQANNVVTTVAGLTPAGYPGNKSSLQTARKMLQTARLDLVTAGQDGKKIIQGLRSFKTTSITPIATTPTVVLPTPTP